MQDPSDSMENAEPGEDGQSDTPTSTVLVEVLPGVAAVFGEVPPALELDLIDVGLVPATDRAHISMVLASIGNTATVAGNLGTAVAGAQGLYRLSESTQALLRAGGSLAVKDGAN